MDFRPKQNRILAALAKGEVPLGMEINTGDPSLIEILAYTGFDFYMLDMEHSRVNIETMEHCIRAADAAGITTVVRVIENSPSLIRQAMEAGAQGIIIPHIATAPDARLAAESLRYPPEGKCGVCPSIRAANYSHDGWQQYMEHANKTNMLIPLLEDTRGIDNAEAIFAELKPGVDAVGVGMADIANSLLTMPGEKVDWQHPYLAQAMEKVMALSQKTGVPIISMITSPPFVENVKKAIDGGVKIVLYFIEQQIFYNYCRDAVRAIKKLKLN